MELCISPFNKRGELARVGIVDFDRTGPNNQTWTRTTG